MAQEYLTVEHISLKDIIRFFAKISIDVNVQWNGTPCWTWHKPRSNNKYGQFNWGGKPEAPHRLMYAWIIGPIPKKMRNDSPTEEIDHQCYNTLCCNPAHLRLIPKSLNAIGPKHNAHKTHCPQGHEYTLDNIYYVRGERRCRQCVLRRVREWKAKKKAA